MHNNLPNCYIFLDQYNKKIFENNNTNVGIIYRNYKHNKTSELIKIANACKKKRYWLFVSNDIKLTLKVKADGIYIPAFNKKKSFLNLEKKGLITVGSAHNQKEIKEKTIQKCKLIFLSPVFLVKKSKKFLGIHKFNFLSLASKTNVIALGGINNANIRKLKLLYNVRGFAGIGLFKKKPAFKRPVFIKNNFF